jgi:hypothetical protein
LIRRRRWHLFASRIHKWLALIVGAQLLIWFTSGALMSFLPIGEVRGEHLVDRDAVVAIPPATRFADPDTIRSRATGAIEAIKWHMVGNRAVAEVKTAKGFQLFDAATGAALPPIDAGQATIIANAAWKSAQKPKSSASRVTEESSEYRGALPAWRIAYADPDTTSVFVAAETGKITAVRTGTWRLYDFFWGLHIMDWKNHENFNTPWLFGFAVGGLMLALAGTMLLVLRWPFRRSRRRR